MKSLALKVLMNFIVSLQQIRQSPIVIGRKKRASADAELLRQLNPEQDENHFDNSIEEWSTTIEGLGEREKDPNQWTVAREYTVNVLTSNETLSKNRRRNDRRGRFESILPPDE